MQKTKNISNNFYKNLIENIDVGVYFVDQDRKITFFNKAAERITGYSAEEVVNACCGNHAFFSHMDEMGNYLCSDQCPVHATITDGKIRNANVYIYHKKGYKIPIRVSSSQIRDEQGNVIGAVETFFDTSFEHKIEKEKEDFKLLAMNDELTGLPNRRYLEEWLVAKHREYKTFGRRYGIVLVDIDNFKNVNDTYGHLVGDDMLKIVAKTLSTASRSNDISARFGGEEFMMVLSGIDEQKLHQFGKRVCSLICNSILEVGQIDLSVSVSIGGAVIEEDDDIKSLIRKADEYLYKAKTTGKNRVCTKIGIDVIGVELNAGNK